MKLFKFLWTTHKWTGIILGIVFLQFAVTGFLLLLKKEYAWIQPPTQAGAEGGTGDFITLQELFARVFSCQHPDFKSLEDIDRVDFRPGKRIHKVRSKHNYAEIQVDAVTGAVLSEDWRTSDLLEQMHDGQFYARWLHNYFMPLVAVALAFLVLSGLYLWLFPLLRKKLREQEARQARAAEARRTG
ncbi:MAG: PepSY domain-containing protein [Planctomycetota bacterium]|jgi:uncharacterized iron-regulated membrane protein